MAFIPTFISKSENQAHQTNPLNEAFNNRIIFLSGSIDTSASVSIVSQLLYLDSIDATEPVHLYISSPGGSVLDGYSIIDIMDRIEAPVYTYCLGMAASMGALIFISGQKRHMLKNSELMLHQPLGGVQGQATDIVITANRILAAKEKINQYIADKSSLSLETVNKEMDRDRWFSAQEALDAGLADEIL